MALNENEIKYSASNKEIQDLNEKAQKYAEKLLEVLKESSQVIVGQEDAIKKN